MAQVLIAFRVPGVGSGSLLRRPLSLRVQAVIIKVSVPNTIVTIPDIGTVHIL